MAGGLATTSELNETAGRRKYLSRMSLIVGVAVHLQVHGASG